MRRRFVTLDVFTAQRYAGNPLAIVIESDGLDADQMQAMAREFNLSETVFVEAPANPEHRAKLRIFTPGAELPFAGHPTIGAAVLLGALTSRQPYIVFEEGIGLVRCVAEQVDRDHGRARFELPRLPAEIEATISKSSALATALGLRANDIGDGEFNPGIWSAGVPLLMLPLASLDAVARCRLDMAKLTKAFGELKPPLGIYVFCRAANDPANAFHTRMFAPQMGIAEDPATGAAAAALAGMVARFGKLNDGEHTFGIEQGYEMGRPSLIKLHVTMNGGELESAGIGGEAIIVSEGRIEA